MSRSLHAAACGIHAHRTQAAQHRLNAALSQTLTGRLYHRFWAAAHEGEALRCQAWLEALR